jgi:UDP-N-acetylglucosamine acyltransferase
VLTKKPVLAKGTIDSSLYVLARSLDVPPYILAMGEPITFGGLNRIGLERRGFSKETLALLKKAFKFIYRHNLTTEEALSKIRDEIDQIPEILHLTEFITKSERGIIR